MREPISASDGELSENGRRRADLWSCFSLFSLKNDVRVYRVRHSDEIKPGKCPRFPPLDSRRISMPSKRSSTVTFVVFFTCSCRLASTRSIHSRLSNAASSHPRSSNDYSSIFRELFHRSSSNKTLKLSKEVVHLSAVLIEASPMTAPFTMTKASQPAHEICLFSESPHYIVRVGHREGRRAPTNEWPF